MAEAVEEKAPAVPVGMPMKMVLILVGGTLVVALGGAFAMFKVMAGSSDKAAAEATAEKPAAHGEAEAKGGGNGAVAETGAIADLDPFIVNLADSPEVRYLKVTMKLELTNASAAEEITARTPQIRDAILVLLTSLDSVTARSPQGKHKLREDVTA
ncbi:MAG: flagellar basal body-associated FliL family protein, partial [Nitrospira sp.]